VLVLILVKLQREATAALSAWVKKITLSYGPLEKSKKPILSDSLFANKLNTGFP
jgi:hypothetical protein